MRPTGSMYAGCYLLQVAMLQLHGTGTGLGDPIEIGAAAAVHEDSSTATTRQQPLGLITSKCTLGHAEPAAGVVGILHSLQAVQQGALPPLIHLRNINPFVTGALAMQGRDKTSAFHLPRQLSGRNPCLATQSDVLEHRLVAGVSSFAFQGGLFD